MNILFVVLQNPLVRTLTVGEQVRSKLLWDAIRNINAGGGNYILTSFAQDAPNENQFVRYFSVKSQGESYRSLKGLFKKFYKTLAGMGFLPERFVKEFNPNYYFPGIRFDYIILRFQRAACLFPYHKIAPIILDYDDHPLQCYDTIAVRRNLP